MGSRELNFTGYNWCGVHTKVHDRLANKDLGINELDEACKSHDILYEFEKDPSERREADIALAKSAARFTLNRRDNDKQDISNASVIFKESLERADLYPDAPLEEDIPINFNKFHDDPYGYMNVRKTLKAKAKLEESGRQILEEILNEDKLYEKIKSTESFKRVEKENVEVETKVEEAETKGKKDDDGGMLNKFINWLPFELHMPGYNYCGPGTKFMDRLKNKDDGINELDEACKAHDLLYTFTKNASDRRQADIVLAKESVKVMFDPNVSRYERTCALFTSLVMINKAELKNNKQKKQKRRIPLLYSIFKLIKDPLSLIDSQQLGELMDEYMIKRGLESKPINESTHNINGMVNSMESKDTSDETLPIVKRVMDFVNPSEMAPDNIKLDNEKIDEDSTEARERVESREALSSIVDERKSIKSLLKQDRNRNKT